MSTGSYVELVRYNSVVRVCKIFVDIIGLMDYNDIIHNAWRRPTSQINFVARFRASIAPGRPLGDSDGCMRLTASNDVAGVVCLSAVVYFICRDRRPGRTHAVCLGNINGLIEKFWSGHCCS